MITLKNCILFLSDITDLSGLLVVKFIDNFPSERNLATCDPVHTVTKQLVKHDIDQK